MKNRIKIGRWPILCSLHANNEREFTSLVGDVDFFSRFEFDQESDVTDSSPDAILERAKSVDIEQSLEKAREYREEYFDLEEYLDGELIITQHSYGSFPDREIYLSSAKPQSASESMEAIDKWLLEWEMKQKPLFSPELAREPWFEDDPCAIVLLPIKHGWESLAYMHWYGSFLLGSEFYVAIFQRWEQTFGAELVANHGTMLQVQVKNPPNTIIEAWEVANIQDLIAPYSRSVASISMRDRAFGLLQHDRWFLHERP